MMKNYRLPMIALITVLALSLSGCESAPNDAFRDLFSAISDLMERVANREAAPLAGRALSVFVDYRDIECHRKIPTNVVNDFVVQPYIRTHFEQRLLRQRTSSLL